jgi:CHAD domain-containing protein
VSSDLPIRKDSGLVHWMNEVPSEADKAVAGFSSEAVHDLRVALRRCRSMADGFRAIDPCKDWKRMRRQATALFDSLGALRDCHVMMEWARNLGQADDPIANQLLEHLGRQEPILKRQARNAIEAFDGKQWQNWTRSLSRRAANLPVGSDVFQALALERLISGRRLQSPALKTGNEVAIHRLRIGLKKFRYVVENFLPQLHQEWRDGLKTAQDLLGEIHDLDVFREAGLSLCASTAPEALQRWQAVLASERLMRVERYANLMSGANSLWRIWRSALPRGQAAREASLKKLQAWSAYLDSDLHHGRRVARFAVQIHDSLARFGLLNGGDKNSRELLRAAATVHEVGRFEGNKNHHKRTQRMVSKLGPIVGWTRQDLITMASVARYHRGALPQSGRLRDLPVKQRKLIALLAGILRLANALDAGHDGSIRRIRVSQNAGFIVIEAQGLRTDSKLAEGIAGARHLLEATCGFPILVRPMPNRTSRTRAPS